MSYYFKESFSVQINYNEFIRYKTRHTATRLSWFATDFHFISLQEGLSLLDQLCIEKSFKCLNTFIYFTQLLPYTNFIYILIISNTSVAMIAHFCVTKTQGIKKSVHCTSTFYSFRLLMKSCTAFKIAMHCYLLTKVSVIS